MQALPIQMISTPNFYSQLHQWDVQGGNAYTLWFQLQVSDNLSTRRYIPSPGATVQVVFMRSRSATIMPSAPQSLPITQQTITKSAIQDMNDRSMFNIAITSTDSNTLISGTVQFIITEGSTVTTFNQSYMIRKTVVAAGC